MPQGARLGNSEVSKGPPDLLAGECPFLTCYLTRVFQVAAPIFLKGTLGVTVEIPGDHKPADPAMALVRLPSVKPYR